MKNRASFSILIAGSFGFSDMAFAQNLVPNGGFEEYDWDCDFGVIYSNLNDWRSLNCGNTPGFAHVCNNDMGNGSGVPQGGLGYQQAHGGDGFMMTIPMFTDALSGVPDANPRLYANVDFTQPLQADHLYCLRFWMNLADSTCYKVDRFHARVGYGVPTLCTSADTAWDTNATATFDISTVDSSSWHLLEAEFVANGGETNLTLGCFQMIDEVSATFIADHIGIHGSLFAGYFIDDVEVMACQVGIPETAALSFSLFPDPADAHTLLQFEGTSNAMLRLLNSLGQDVTPPNWPRNLISAGQHTLDTSELPSGQYVVQLVSKHGNTGVRRLIVQH
jgi:hypothetical protein